MTDPQDHNPSTPDSRLQTRDSELETQQLIPSTRNSELGTRNSKPGTPELLIGLLLRLILIFTTVGSSDAVYKSLWAKMAAEHGTYRAYALTPYLNDPPVAVATSATLWRWSENNGWAFADLFRLIQVAADLGTFFLLLALARRLALPHPRIVSLLYFLSPAAIFISGFHCNADPAMLFFVVLSLFAAASGFALLAGIALAVATGVKVVPLLLLPLFLVALKRRAPAFLAGYAATMSAIFLPGVLIAGPAVLRNVFQYKGVGNWWGLGSILLSATRAASASSRDLFRSLFFLQQQSAQFVVACIVLALAALLWKRTASLPEEASLRLLVAAVAVVFLSSLFVASGFGVQYLLWPLPFLSFALRRRFVLAIHLAISVFLFAIYTHWSGGFPWSYADSEKAGAINDSFVHAGWLLWLLLGAAALTAARRIGSETQESVQPQPS